LIFNHNSSKSTKQPLKNLLLIAFNDLIKRLNAYFSKRHYPLEH
jgi:hypothetical protein